MPIFDITPLVNSNAPRALRQTFQFGMRKGLKYVVVNNFTKIDWSNEDIVGSYTVKQYTVDNEVEDLVNEFEFNSIASNASRVFYNGDLAPKDYNGSEPTMGEWDYFTYLLMVPGLLVPDMVAGYAQVLFMLGRFDKPKHLQHFD